MRTLAVYLVVLFHAGLGWIDGGFIGVDLFFVLSGFLVTIVIVSEIDRTGTLRLSSFYARRVRRLLPAAAVVVVATAFVYVLVAPVSERLSLVRDAQSALLYVANWNFLAQSGDYFAADADKSPFLHFWSLAIEEQYYVFFPVLLLLLTRRGRRWTVGVLAALCAASVLAQLVWAQVDTDHDELALVLHVDGNGTQPAKLETWNALQRDLPEGIAMGWKNFIDEDHPMLDPASTMAIEPTPVFVSYQ